MDHVIKSLREAKVTNAYTLNEHLSGRTVYYNLFWEKQNITIQYRLSQFLYKGSPTIMIEHEYDPLLPKCPLCQTVDELSCLEFSEHHLEFLKDKLIQHNLKLMYVLPQ